MKNACIKWAYRQPTSRGWCQLPPNIGYRFDSGNKHNMRSLMEHIEQAMREMIKLAEATLDDPPRSASHAEPCEVDSRSN